MPVVNFIPAFGIYTQGSDLAYMVKFERTLKSLKWVKREMPEHGTFEVHVPDACSSVMVEMDYVEDQIFVEGDIINILMLKNSIESEIRAKQKHCVC